MNTKLEHQTNMTDSKICDKCGAEMQYVEDFFENFFIDLNKKMGIANNEEAENIDKAYHWECKNCIDIRDREFELREKEKNDREDFERVHYGIPKIYHHCKITDFTNIDRVLAWAKKPSGFLYIHGTTGTGKTHLICAIKKRYNEIGVNSSLFFSSDIFLEIRNSFNSKDSLSEDQIISKCTYGIAFFDDFGTQKNSEFSIETWYNIINTRYMNDIPTIFTSNITLKEISMLMSDRIASRIASGDVFELKGSDRRITNKSPRMEPRIDLTEVF